MELSAAERGAAEPEEAERGAAERDAAEGRLRLFLRQKKLLETFLERRAITRAQYDRSLSCMASGMGIELDGSGAPIRRF